MNESERIKLADAFKTSEFKDGDYVIKHGEEGKIFYIIEEGKAKAIIDDKCVMNYKKGD